MSTTYGAPQPGCEARTGFHLLLCDDGATDLEFGDTQNTGKVVCFAVLVPGCAGGACGRAWVGVM